MLFGTGKKGAKIMFVADMPTILEYQMGKYMVGRAGDILKATLKSVGIKEEDCYFTAYVKDKPEDNEGIPTKKQILESVDVFNAEVEVINPEIIVPMDNVALKRIYGVTGITKYRGKAEIIDNRIILPILHPKLLFSQPKHVEKWGTDIKTLKSLYVQGKEYFNQSGVNYRYLETYEEVEEEIERLMTSEWVCYDLETTGLDAFGKDSKIVCISLTDRTHYGVTIPLEHNEFKWDGVTLDKIKGLLKRLLENMKVKKMAYNGKFDSTWLLVHYGIDVKPFKFDPMLCHYLCVSEERGGHSLKNLAWEFTDMGGYENDLDKYKSTLPKEIQNNYYYIKWEILREYASADVDCTFRIYEALKHYLDENPKWNYIFNILLLQGSDMLRDMEINGAYIDMNVLEKYEREYTERIQQIENELRTYPEVVAIEREKLELYQKRAREMKKPKEERDPKIVAIPTKYKNFKFNFGSTDHLRELFFVKLGLETPFLTKKGEERKRKEGRNFKPTLKEMSTGAETLDYLADKHPITKLLSEWRALEKVYGTYVAPARSWLDENNLVHSTYMLHGTVTGRLASEKPNCQNFPRKCNVPSDFQYSHGIKKMFTSRFGEEGVILQFDYSQLELRVTGMFSQDEGLLGAYRSGKDIHRYSAGKAMGVPYDEVTSDMRTSAKAINFGLIYGKGVKALAGDMKDGTVEKAQEFMDAYFQEFPKVKEWLDNTKAKVKKDKYVENLLGRHRRLAGVDSTNEGIKANCMRQSVNAPIQSTGSDIMLLSMIMINMKFKALKLKSKMAITVHDSLVVDVYLPELEKVWSIMKDTMEHPEYIKGFEFASSCPLVAEAEIGRSYGGLIEIGSLDELDEFGGDVFAFIDDRVQKKYEKDLENEKKFG